MEVTNIRMLLIIYRYTPFGDGMATVIIPQLHRHDNTLFMWNNHNLESPIHCFYGHRDVILDFGWRKFENSNDVELVCIFPTR